ncbi:PhoX family protein [Nocardioides coralli]|uniref:PhoX family protein n=1 Tax=Nocardioides coralli TaxID=2872154 RepID=UPI001CA3F672|nr:PhoX family phosphatase [Nocardioides coralli]QZY30481.1 PhoX family phosphatase [Nocardioides coralli]
MTVTPPRPLLPLITENRHGSRSHLTCLYRCGNACDQPVPNTSDNPEFRTIAEQALARRSFLKVGAGAGALTVAGVATGTPLAAAAVAGSTAGTWRFRPVEPNDFDDVTVPRGFEADVVIRWGDKVLRGAPAFDVRNQTPEAATQQFGYNNDYVGVLPHPTRKNGAVLVANHEYTDENLMFPTGTDSELVKRVAMASHGMSVVELRRGRKRGSWVRRVPGRSPLNRRLHTQSDFRLVGPAAGHERLQTSADPTGRMVKGTLNNCAGGLTPWGTVLSGEENFNQYFHASGARDPRYTASYDRYGVSGVSARRWDTVDDRFDLSREPHEPFRFGWIVEVDPFDPDSTPRKHTMLGRFKHEGANVTVADNGQVVAYMGDDERFDYIYKFVSAGTIDRGRDARARRRNMRLLTTGTLYVARFRGDGREDEQFDGSGTWIPLTSDTESFVEGMSVAEVLLDTRLAADTVSPTKMDRPEDIEVNPVNGNVYCALTNNSQRDTEAETDEANPLWQSRTRASLGAPLVVQNGNRNGYVLEMEPANGNHASRNFFWRLMLVCGDPRAPETYFAGFPKDRVSPISCPDNVAFDAAGNLWISTDGNALGSNDGLFRVPTEGPHRGHVQQFLTVPYGAEACGPFITDDQRSVFIAPQHPGETNGATFENQSSTWPDRNGYPRPSVVVVYEQ